MTVTNVDANKETLTMTITSEFNAPVENVWSVWEDARKLEKWWGPPMFPATFIDHALEPNGRAFYYMTGPDGEKYYGIWSITTVEPNKLIEFNDEFADESGTPDSSMPATQTRVSFETLADGRIRMFIAGTFSSLESMEQLLEMGMDEGLRTANAQIDALL